MVRESLVPRKKFCGKCWCVKQLSLHCSWRIENTFSLQSYSIHEPCIKSIKSISIIGFKVLRGQGVWGAAAPQPPEAEKRQGVWGAAATPSRRRQKKGRGSG